MEQALESVVIRPIRAGDVEAIVQVDALITGKKKAGLWRGILGAYLSGEGEQREGLSPELCQVALDGDKLVGFMVGDVQSWQFGMPRCARIVTIGVHPEYRRRLVASQLIEAIFEVFSKFGLPRIQCLVGPGDPLGDFFTAAGFEDTGMTVMGRKL